MTATVLPQSVEFQSNARRGTNLAVTVVLGVWLVLVIVLGADGAFVAPPKMPPLAFGVAVVGPVVLFFAWLWLSKSFREFVVSLDLRLIAAIQAWRWAGLGFLPLYTYKVLPGVFALTAGLGDMAVGVVAPWIVLALVRRPGFAASASFIRWNLLGILDLVVAVSLGTLSSLFATGAAGEVTSAPMETLPLLLIPAFLVPLFLMLHTAALMQSRQFSRSEPKVLSQSADGQTVN
jgi:hypothetical protein